VKKTPLRRISKSPSAVLKTRIQALLRAIVIIRDGGCVLRSVLGGCSGPLQAEHLITRSNAATFGDTRNIVCLCQHHHIFWKPQHSRQYWELIKQHVGPVIWAWLELAESDHSPHKVDLVLTEIVLIGELKKISTNYPQFTNIA
jgi:hypothetical protein